MNNDNLSIERIPHLNSNRWEKTIHKAKQQVVNSLTEPHRADYDKQVGSVLTPRVQRLMIIGLCIVAFAAFVISAGKQITATTMLFDPIAQNSEHLSWVWADASIILGLALGEIGTIIFSVACSMFSEHKGKVAVFRVFSIICATLAILANVTITALHDNSGFVVWAWFVTLAPPLTVIAVGLLIESLVMRNMKAQLEAQREYDIDHREYEYFRARPEQHTTFKRRWYLSIYEELCYRKEDRLLIEALVNEDQAIKGALVRREIEIHEFWEVMDIARPTLPPSMGDTLNTSSQPLLN
jgi:hypothetical protein